MLQTLFRMLRIQCLKNRVQFWFSVFILITCCFSFLLLYFIGQAHREKEVVVPLQQVSDLQHPWIDWITNPQWLGIVLGVLIIIILTIGISTYITLQLSKRYVFNNMSEMIRNKLMLVEEREERFRMPAEHSGDMITIHDMQGLYQYVSPASTRLLGYPTKALLGKIVFDYIHPDDLKSMKANLLHLLKTDYVLTTFRIRAKDGEYVWFESTLKAIKDQDGKLREVIAVSRNITERKLMELELKESNERLHYLSSTDTVTGIANRRYLEEYLEQEWQQAMEESIPIAIILVDIDCFKEYNDTYGHQDGDDSLQLVAKTLTNTLQGIRGLVARYGGEEFIVVLPDADKDEAFRKAEEIRSSVEGLQIIHDTSPISPYVTVSVGVSTMIPESYQSTDMLIAEADKALYEAKRVGRNQVKVRESVLNINQDYL